MHGALVRPFTGLGDMSGGGLHPAGESGPYWHSPYPRGVERPNLGRRLEVIIPVTHIACAMEKRTMPSAGTMTNRSPA